MFTITPKNQTKKFLLLIIILVSLLLSSSPTIADNDYGLGKTGTAAGLTTSGSLATIIGNIIFIVLGFLGVIFLALVIYGGLTWMTARGNKEQVGKAQGVITSAAIGLVIVLASYTITSFVVNQVTESITLQVTTQRCVCSSSSCYEADGITSESPETHCTQDGNYPNNCEFCCCTTN